MSVIGWIFAIVTMVGFAALGVLYTRRKTVTLEDYLTARSSASGSIAMATVVASIMGAWILFSPAEAATWAGLVAIIGYGIGQAAPILAFMVLGPRLRRLMPHGHSLTEYIWNRYGKVMYGLTLVIIVFYMFTFLTAEMTGIALAVQLVTDTPLGLTVLLVGVATLAYTVYGGLRASIFTDTIQFVVLFPLLILVLTVVLLQLGGWGDAFTAVKERAPALLSMGHRPGIEFGITLVIAILSANMFHQGIWQRVYACKTDRDLRIGFLLAGVLVIPMVIAVGLFGLWAVGREVANPASVALFTLALNVLPGWSVVALIVLAVVLVMSSMDTLLNGIASVFTSDLLRLQPTWGSSKLLCSSRTITVALAVPAMVIASQGYSVLYMFLIADLVCAGALIPTFLGLYLRRYTGSMAATSALLGIGVGALFFPTPSLTGWWSIPGSGNLIVSFVSAIVTSSVVSAVMAYARGRDRNWTGYDFGDLERNVTLLEEGQPSR